MVLIEVGQVQDDLGRTFLIRYTRGGGEIAYIWNEATLKYTQDRSAKKEALATTEPELARGDDRPED